VIARAAAALLVLRAGCVFAGAPLVTDDAAVVAAGSCQIEAWGVLAHDGRGAFAQPACNLLADTELALGVSRNWPDDESASSTMLAQLKHVFAAAHDGAWAFAASAGASRDTAAAHGNSAFDTGYARAIATFNAGDRLAIDVNGGIADTRGSGSYALGGLALRYAAPGNVQLLGEVYHDSPGTAKAQVGVRVAVVPDRFEVYASYGERLADRGDWWVIVGVRLQTRRLLPRPRTTPRSPAVRGEAAGQRASSGATTRSSDASLMPGSSYHWSRRRTPWRSTTNVSGSRQMRP
jgi:hypothetical protein